MAFVVVHSRDLMDYKTSGNTFSHFKVLRFIEVNARVIDFHITPFALLVCRELLRVVRLVAIARLVSLVLWHINQCKLFNAI